MTIKGVITMTLNVQIDCANCLGFCCVALYFSKTDGFPEDKRAGEPCLHLAERFTCNIHGELATRNMKGCMTYDCFGAGQQVAQVTYGGRDWRTNRETAEQMYDAFLKMRQLYEIYVYATEAARIAPSKPLQTLIAELETVAAATAEQVVALDAEQYRQRVRPFIHEASAQLQRQYRPTFKAKADLFGADLRKKSLRGADLRGCFLIAANLAGADLTGANVLSADFRDANVSGANLANSYFLTQMQVNSMKGDATTRIPAHLTRPSQWM